MQTAKQSAPVTVYQLKVSLRGISPMVWRRLLVTSDTTIAELHDVLQIAMGWEDLHLHRFRVHGREYGVARSGGLFFADDPHQVRLADFRLRKSERFVYEYDMGDFWQHDLRLEAVLALDPTTRYPRCIAGSGDCPPEDCGGPEGYRSLLDERSSWSALEALEDDMALVAQRLLDWEQGGPQPTYDDGEFCDALERMQERQANDPVAFSRRAVNTALRTMKEVPPCTSASTSLPSRTTARSSSRRSPN
jgi:hypothetical protein